MFMWRWGEEEEREREREGGRLNRRGRQGKGWYDERGREGRGRGGVPSSSSSSACAQDEHSSMLQPFLYVRYPQGSTSSYLHRNPLQLLHCRLVMLSLSQSTQVSFLPAREARSVLPGPSAMAGGEGWYCGWALQSVPFLEPQNFWNILVKLCGSKYRQSGFPESCLRFPRSGFS